MLYHCLSVRCSSQFFAYIISFNSHTNLPWEMLLPRCTDEEQTQEDKSFAQLVQCVSGHGKPWRWDGLTEDLNHLANRNGHTLFQLWAACLCLQGKWEVVQVRGLPVGVTGKAGGSEWDTEPLKALEDPLMFPWALDWGHSWAEPRSSSSSRSFIVHLPLTPKTKPGQYLWFHRTHFSLGVTLLLFSTPQNPVLSSRKSSEVPAYRSAFSGMGPFCPSLNL